MDRNHLRYYCNILVPGLLLFPGRLIWFSPLGDSLHPYYPSRQNAAVTYTVSCGGAIYLVEGSN